MKKRMIQYTLNMTNLDKRYLLAVSIFMMLTAIYLISDINNSVFWAIYCFGIKDALIIALASLFMGKNEISDLLSIGLITYLSVPTLIRISCAIESKFNYLAYRELLNNSEYSYFLLVVLFLISILIYYGCKNERKI